MKKRIPVDRPNAAITRRDVIHAGLAGAAALAVSPTLLSALVPNAPARPYLDTALSASRWLERAAQRDGSGVWWPADPANAKAPTYDLYNGTTGVLPFWVELHAATGEARALEMVRAAADHLVTALDSVDRADAGLYTGLAGMGWALGLAYRVTRDARHAAGAARALGLVKGSASADRNGRGVRWADSTDIISGAAGTGLYLLRAHSERRDDAALALATRAGHALVAAGESAEGGLRWRINATMPREYPNFSHGTAGVAFFLARLHVATRDRAFLDASLAGARYLQAIATTTASDGRMVHHSTPGNEQLFYLSWCHGPPGTARLFHTLGAITGDAAHARYADQLSVATIDMKVPDRSAGFWNNISQCCGNCGVTEYFVARHGLTRDAKALAFAETVARDTIARGTVEGDGMKWVQAENRTSPEAVVAQTGLMQGAAGVGLAMLHLDGAVSGRRRVVVLPDDLSM